MNTDTRRSPGIFIAILLTTLFLLGLNTGTARADLIRCRADPLVILSNGKVLDISADVGTWLWNITKIQYVLHVPTGVSAILVIRTPNWPTTIETFTIISDNPAGVYSGTTTVYTTDANVPVTASLLVGLKLDLESGFNGQALNLLVNSSGLIW